MRSAILLFLTTAVLAVPLTFVFRWLAVRTRFVAHPNSLIVTHRAPVAYLGGLAVWLAASGSMAVVPESKFGASGGTISNALEFYSAAIPFLLLGLVDDRVAFRPLVKAALQLLAAIFGIVVSGQTSGSVFEIGLAVFWIVLIVNAVNFLDVSDGFAATVMLATLLGLAAIVESWQLALVAVSGACLGFLVFNRPPASIYLGDAGSHFLGAVAALATLPLLGSSKSVDGTIQVLLMLGVTLFELVFVTFVRMKKKLPWWRGSPDHVALRLQAAGWSRGQAALLAGCAQILLVFVALACGELKSNECAGVAILVLILAIWIARELLRWEMSEIANPTEMHPPGAN